MSRARKEQGGTRPRLKTALNFGGTPRAADPQDALLQRLRRAGRSGAAERKPLGGQEVGHQEAGGSRRRVPDAGARAF